MEPEIAKIAANFLCLLYDAKFSMTDERRSKGQLRAYNLESRILTHAIMTTALFAVRIDKNVLKGRRILSSACRFDVIYCIIRHCVRAPNDTNALRESVASTPKRSGLDDW